MSSVQYVSSRHSMRQENVTHHQEKRQSIEINPKMTQRLELADKDFKAAIISIFKDLKEKLFRITKTDKAYQTDK